MMRRVALTKGGVGVDEGCLYEWDGMDDELFGLIEMNYLR